MKSHEGSIKTKILLITAIFLCACSSTPRGQVVRLDPAAAVEKSDEEQSPVPTNNAKIYSQAENKSAIEAVPSDKADAAVFYFSQGQAFSLDGDFKHAIEAYRATLVYDPSSPLVHARLAAELVKQGSFAEAKILCEKAIQLDPKYVDSYLLLAGIQVAAKEYDQSLQTYKQALAVDGTNRDALLYYGVTLAETGKIKESIKNLEILVKMKDSSESTIDQSVAHYYLAKVYQQANNMPEAIKNLHASIKKRPGFSKAALMLADIYETQKNRKQARAVLEEVFAENHQAEIAEKLADMSLEENNFKGAVVYLETLVEEDPSNENVRLRLALVYWQIQWLDKARLVLGDLHERYPTSSEISFYLGELELERKESDSALVYYKEVHPDYSKYDQAVGRISYIYRDQKNYSEGEEYLKSVLKKRPDMVNYYPVLASFYEDENKLSDAVSALEMGRERFPQDENVLYYLGFLYDRAGKKEDSLSTMKALLQVSPNNANALNFVGYTLLERGTDLIKASEYLEKAVQLKPKDPFVMDSYGWLLYKKGKFKEAMVYLEKAFGAKQEEAVIAEHLADIYLAMNLPAKALAVYQKALGISTLGNDDDVKTRLSQKISNLKGALARDEYSPSRISKRVPASVSTDEE